MKYPLYQKTLCPDIWEGGKMKPEVQKGLLDIAVDFVNELRDDHELEIEIVDVVVIGSVANYNWSPYSDIDLHVITDYSKLEIPAEEAQIMFDALKVNWNNKHEITVKGHDVEMYVQDKTYKPSSAAEYSVLNNKWIKEPVHESPAFDKDLIKKKYKEYKKKINDLVASGDEDGLRNLLDKLYKYRQAGLDTGGELSEENIVFKILRAAGQLDKIKDVVVKLYDKKMTVNEHEPLSDGIWPELDDDQKPTGRIRVEPDGDSIYDELVATGNKNEPALKNVEGVTVYPAYQVTRGVERTPHGPDMLKTIRHALKHPLDAAQEKIVNGLIKSSVEEFSKKIPLSKIDVIIPLGSSSRVNLRIADEIVKASGKKIPILNGFIVKDVWKNVQVKPRMPKEFGPNPSKKQIDAYRKIAMERDSGFAGAVAHLEKMKRLHPDDPFEIKNSGGHGRAWRIYYTLFYRTADGYSVNLINKIDDANVLIIDDTLEGGTTLKDAIRVINTFNPKSVSAYIFLFGRYGSDTRTHFKTRADTARQQRHRQKTWLTP